MEMLRTKIPQVTGLGMLDNRRMVGGGSSDEDPYSIAGSGSSGSSGNGNSRNRWVMSSEEWYRELQIILLRSSSRDKPPQLPPRDNGIYGALWSNNAGNQQDKKDKKKQPGDDPYYFGLSARIPNFVKSRKKKQKERSRMMAGHGQVIFVPNSIIQLRK